GSSKNGDQRILRTGEQGVPLAHVRRGPALAQSLAPAPFVHPGPRVGDDPLRVIAEHGRDAQVLLADGGLDAALGVHGLLNSTFRAGHQAPGRRYFWHFGQNTLVLPATTSDFSFPPHFTHFSP